MESVDFLSFVTPFAVKKHIHSQFKDDQKTFFWNNLQVSYGNRYWVSTTSVESESTCNKIGLVSGHTFEIKGVYQDSHSGSMIRLVHLSSNTKKDTWKGEYADDSDKWTDDLKEQVKFSLKQSGEFFVSYDEYLENFEYTSMCLYAPEFEMITHMEIKQPLGMYTIVKMTLVQSTEAIFKVTQPFTERDHPGVMRIVINKDVEENKEIEEKIYHIDGTLTQGARSIYLETQEELSKGTYYIYIEVDDKNIEYSLTLISNTLIKMKTIPNSDYPTFIEDMVKSYMNLKHNNYRCAKNEPDIQMKSYFGAKLAGFGAHYFINHTKNQTTYLENITYEDRKEIEFLFDHAKEGKSLEVRVEPGEEVLKIIKKLTPSAQVDLSYSNAFIYPDEHVEKECVAKGTSRAIKNSEDKDSKCLMYSYQHDCGYVFYFVNRESALKLDAYVAFTKATNLDPGHTELDKSTGEPYFHFVLEPEEEKYIHLKRKDFAYKFGVAYKSSFKLIELNKSPRNFT